jgi:hypothetical protein
MANWKKQTAQLGIGAVVAGLQALRAGMRKRQYKRVLATAVAQLLTLHPDIGARQARQRARKVTGAKPAKKLLVKAGRSALAKGAETVVATAASAGALKVVSKLGRKVAKSARRSRAGERQNEASVTTP